MSSFMNSLISSFMNSFRVALIGLSLLLSGCLSGPVSESSGNSLVNSDVERFGVLVMAHGGGEKWNQGVLSSVAPLRKLYEVEVAFGMADAVSMQQAVEKLEEKGVNKIAVVRMFISGESWFERTQKILGIVKGAPQRPDQKAEKKSKHHGHSMEFWRIDSNSKFVMSQSGLSEAEQMNKVLVDRVKELSVNTVKEDVLILAHGPADDKENQRWLANINARTENLKAQFSFRRVKVETLREDWSGKRAVAEKKIRYFVKRAKAEDGIAIVIPYRVQGFGPYAKVLAELDYLSNGQGLVPHENVTHWLLSQVATLKEESNNSRAVAAKK